MKFFNRFLSASLLLVSATTSANFTDRVLPHIYYVSFESQTESGSITLSGQYRLPRQEHNAPVPAVIIAHSSGGVDSTGKWYARSLNKLGIATLELDMWSPRGFVGGTNDRPQTVQETIPDAYAALDFLAAKPEIDADNIGIIGFSWGGVVAMLSATEHYYQLSRTSENKFAAHIAHYPVCWSYNFLPGFEFNDLVGSPIMIQIGGKDDYEADPLSCENFVQALPIETQSLVTLNNYKNGHHAWDRLEASLRVFDIFGNRGQGAEVDLIGNRKIAKKSRNAVNEFFLTHLTE